MVPLGRLERPTNGLGMRSAISCPLFSNYSAASFEAKITCRLSTDYREILPEVTQWISKRISRTVTDFPEATDSVSHGCGYAVKPTPAGRTSFGFDSALPCGTVERCPSGKMGFPCRGFEVLDLPWVSLCVAPNNHDRCLLGKDLMVPKQAQEKAEAACLLSANHYTFTPHTMQLSVLRQ